MRAMRLVADFDTVSKLASSVVRRVGSAGRPPHSRFRRMSISGRALDLPLPLEYKKDFWGSKRTAWPHFTESLKVGGLTSPRASNDSAFSPRSRLPAVGDSPQSPRGESRGFVDSGPKSARGLAKLGLTVVESWPPAWTQPDFPMPQRPPRHAAEFSYPRPLCFSGLGQRPPAQATARRTHVFQPGWKEPPRRWATELLVPGHRTLTASVEEKSVSPYSDLERTQKSFVAALNPQGPIRPRWFDPIVGVMVVEAKRDKIDFTTTSSSIGSWRNQSMTISSDPFNDSQ